MVLDALTEVELFIHVFVVVYILAILAYILTSWINLPYSLRGAQRFLYDVCEPYLRLWRRLLRCRGCIARCRRCRRCVCWDWWNRLLCRWLGLGQ